MTCLLCLYIMNLMVSKRTDLVQLYPNIPKRNISIKPYNEASWISLTGYSNQYKKTGEHKLSPVSEIQFYIMPPG